MGPREILFVARDAGFAWDLLGRQLFLGLAHHRDFRNGVDADGKVRGHAAWPRHAEHPAGGEPALLGRGCGERGKPMTSPAAKMWLTEVR